MEPGTILALTTTPDARFPLGMRQASSEDLLDSIVSDNIPIYTEQEKYNQCITSVVDRLAAQLKGETVPGGRTGGIVPIGREDRAKWEGGS